MSNSSVPNVYPPEEGLKWVDMSWPEEEGRETYQIKLLVRDNANDVLREQTLPQVYESALDANYRARLIKRVYPPAIPGGKPTEIGIDLLSPEGVDESFTCNGEVLTLYQRLQGTPGVLHWGVDKQLGLDGILGEETLFYVKVDRVQVFHQERNVFYMNDSELPSEVATPEENSEQSGSASNSEA